MAANGVDVDDRGEVVARDSGSDGELLPLQSQTPRREDESVLTEDVVGEGRLPKRERVDRLSRGNSFVEGEGDGEGDKRQRRSSSADEEKPPANGDSQDIAIWNINDNEHR